MKKSLRLLALALAATMLFALIPFSASAATSVSSLKIVCFGDSLTEFGETEIGTDEFGHKLWENAYPDILAELTGAEVYNAGVGGNTTDMASLRFQAEVLDQNPDVVTICLAMNDQALSAETGLPMTSVEAYRANLEKFASALIAEGVDVIFITPTGACTESGYYTPGESDYSGGALPSFCNAMREVAIKYGCGLVDCYDEFTTLSDYSSYLKPNDGIHLSAKGRNYFAGLINEYLCAYYEDTDKASMNIVCKDESGNVLAEYIMTGMEGALVTVASPDLGDGFTTSDADVDTTFVNGATHTFTYRSEIKTALTAANSLIAADEIESIRSAEFISMTNKASALLEADELDFEAIGEATVNLNNAMNRNEYGEYIISHGASYTASTPNYSSGSYLDLDDDGIRLTDGNKSYTCGWDSQYSAWVGNTEIIVDLGEIKNANVFRGYFGGLSGPGVATPNNMSVYYSEDESSWTLAGAAVKSSISAENGKYWSCDALAVSLNTTVKARYVKFVVTGGGFVWADEVEVGYNPSVKNVSYTTSQLYQQADGTNDNWGWDANAEITYPDEGGISLIDGVYGAESIYDAPWAGFHYNAPDYIDKGYHRITFTLDKVTGVESVNVYVGTSALGFGTTSPASIQVLTSENGTDFTAVNTVIPTDNANISGFTTVEKVEIPVNKNTQYLEIRITSGNWVFLGEIEAVEGEITDEIPDTDESGDSSEDESSEPVEDESSEPVEDETSEPVEDETSEPIEDESSEPVENESSEPEESSKPEESSEPVEDETSEPDASDDKSDEDSDDSSDDNSEDSSDDNSDDSSDDNSDDNSEPEKINLGDINGSGEIDSLDYILLKRAFFNTFKLTEEQSKIGDINGNSAIDSLDYILLKRAYFGTYKIK